MSAVALGGTSRQQASYLIIASFLSFVLFLGIGDEVGHVPKILSSLDAQQEILKFPTFGQYIPSRTLDRIELDFDRPNRRIIFVGDIHGMRTELDSLLAKLQYNPSSDLLIHAGDVIAKGPQKGSLAVLDFLSVNNITGVRGNHDQKVIEWRGWIDRVLNAIGGRQWLEKLEKLTGKELKQEVEYLKGKRKRKGKAESVEWKRIPKGWDFLSDHYDIARAMTQPHYSYLLSLPLILHIHDLHTFVVHAGILPLDPSRSVTSLRQPLSHIPHSTMSTEEAFKAKNITLLRTAQERAVYSDVPQNTDPWVTLNMRGIEHDNSITKSSSKGEPWSDLWNSIIERCDGYDNFWSVSDGVDMSRSKKLPCYPSTVVYGHAASRGLDLKRWSKGLDSGCVYNRKLTALVLTSPSAQSSVEAESNTVKFGEKGTANARLVQVDC